MMKILPPREDQPRVANWIFVITWLFGGVALMVGLNGGGAEQTALALLIFLLVCGLWLWAVKLSRGKGIGGFVVVGYWLLNVLLAGLLDFQHYVKDAFFWISIAVICCLIVVFVTLNRQANYNAVGE
jgi:hypothetical protein